jgi:hypothetical protein
MTYQLALAAAGALVLMVTASHAIIHVARGADLNESYLAKLVSLGLLGGAALTPLINHLGG